MAQIGIRENSNTTEAILENLVMRRVAELSSARLKTTPRLGVSVLRITIQQGDEFIRIKLEGRMVGPEVAELNRAWTEIASELGARKLSLDLRDVTYSDAQGNQVLRDIYSQAKAELIADTLWSKHIANEVMKGKVDQDWGGRRR
jgi:hypothetical protein